MNDEQAIRATIQTYFDSLHESSAEKARAAFHPNAMIVGYLEDGLHEMDLPEFADFVAAQQPSPKAQGQTQRTEVLSVFVAGNTASAQVREDYLGLTFLDTLSLLKEGDGWRIYNKLFHVETPLS
jgi:hypothetical protein